MSHLQIPNQQNFLQASSIWCLGIAWNQKTHWHWASLEIWQLYHKANISLLDFKINLSRRAQLQVHRSIHSCWNRILRYSTKPLFLDKAPLHHSSFLICPFSNKWNYVIRFYLKNEYSCIVDVLIYSLIKLDIFDIEEYDRILY